MKYLKFLLVWLCFIPVAILNGGLREYVLIRYLDTALATAISGILLSILNIFV